MERRTEFLVLKQKDREAVIQGGVAWTDLNGLLVGLPPLDRWPLVVTPLLEQIQDWAAIATRLLAGWPSFACPRPTEEQNQKQTK
jgi:hypothetical protein